MIKTEIMVLNILTYLTDIAIGNNNLDILKLLVKSGDIDLEASFNSKSQYKKII
ncbi:hypothetical protein OFQ66_14385 [Brachyspira hyodysenteriae]|nr:hypothetical protein [Brachyspira hyodysenteriae]